MPGCRTHQRQSQSLIRTTGPSSAVHGQWFSDMKRAFVAYEKGELRVWDLKAGTALHSLHSSQFRRTNTTGTTGTIGTTGTTGTTGARTAANAEGAGSANTGTGSASGAAGAPGAEGSLAPTSLAIHEDDILVALGHLDGQATLLNANHGKVLLPQRSEGYLSSPDSVRHPQVERKRCEERHLLAARHLPTRHLLVSRPLFV